MMLNINSPAYYTKKFGVHDEIYGMCNRISVCVKDKRYSDYIDTVGIVPLIIPQEMKEKGMYKEEKKCEIKAGFASVSLQIDYEEYCRGTLEKKKQLIVENILESVKTVSRRGKIDYLKFKEDILEFCKMEEIEINDTKRRSCS